MSATYLPSNLIRPDEKSLQNPNWIQTESGTPVSSIFTEDIQDRLMVVVGKHPVAYVTNFNQDQFLLDNASREVSAVFSMKYISLQQCTGFSLEQVSLILPVDPGASSGRNLSTTLCGDYVDDSFADARRFAPLGTDMTVPLIVNGTVHTFNMTAYLPYGQMVAYYNLGDVITWFLNAWTNFMQNQLGDTSFYATVYVDSASPRIFWSSTTFPPGSIRIALSDLQDASLPTFLSMLKNHLFFLDLRTGDTSQQPYGYSVGESMGILPRKSTGFQNNAVCLTIHSSELTQFRKSDSLAPADGSSLLGVISPAGVYGGGFNSGSTMIVASNKNGALTSPKVSFDKTQTLTEFQVYLRAVDSSGTSSPFQLSAVEIKQCTLMCVFRCW